MKLRQFAKKYKLLLAITFCGFCLLPLWGYFNVQAAETDILTAGERVDIRVALGTGLDKFTFTIDKDSYRITNEGNKTLAEVETGKEITVQSNGSGSVQILVDGSKLGSYSTPITFKADDADKAIFGYNNKQYRGNIVLDGTMSGVLLVNQLDVEYYLYGVVGLEMSSSFPEEALKAQAIACRSYALSNLNPYGKYDVVAGTQDQAYGGYTQEKASGNSKVIDAVDETKGKVIVYENSKGNELILTAFFHANAGGCTESSRNAWGGAENPCLVSVASPYDSKDSNYCWTVELTAKQIEDKVNKYLADRNDDRRLGAYISMEVQRKTADGEENPSGRVNRIIVSGEKSTVYIDKENIRTVFGLKSNKVNIADSSSVYVKQVDGQAQTLDIEEDSVFYASTSSSTAAKIMLDGKSYYIRSKDGVNQLNKDQKITGDKVIFEGFGYGHGVGMSQAGAKYMALDGKDYIDILDLYYNGDISYIKTLYK